MQSYVLRAVGAPWRVHEHCQLGDQEMCGGNVTAVELADPRTEREEARQVGGEWGWDRVMRPRMAGKVGMVGGWPVCGTCGFGSSVVGSGGVRCVCLPERHLCIQ